jgi:hypothetical protein
MAWNECVLRNSGRSLLRGTNSLHSVSTIRLTRWWKFKPSCALCQLPITVAVSQKITWSLRRNIPKRKCTRVARATYAPGRARKQLGTAALPTLALVSVKEHMCAPNPSLAWQALRLELLPPPACAWCIPSKPTRLELQTSASQSSKRCSSPPLLLPLATQMPSRSSPCCSPSNPAL